MTSTLFSAAPHGPRSAWSGRRIAAIAGVVVGATAALGAVPLVASATAPAGGDYCQAHLDLEAAFGSGDPAMIGPAVEAAMAAVPAEIAEALTTAVNNPPPGDGPPSVEFTTAYNEVVAWIKDNCGFTAIDVLLTEYAFGGMPEEVAAGPTVISLTNDGVEVHEMVIFQRNEGVTEPAEELFALPEEELFSKLTPVNGAVVFPGDTGLMLAELAPGDYIAVCFLPVGNTPEQMMAELTAPDVSAAPGGSGAPAMSEAPAMTEPMSTMDMAGMGSAPPGSGPIPGSPHFVEGMIQEFTVVDAGTTATTAA